MGLGVVLADGSAGLGYSDSASANVRWSGFAALSVWKIIPPAADDILAFVDGGRIGGTVCFTSTSMSTLPSSGVKVYTTVSLRALPSWPRSVMSWLMMASPWSMTRPP